MLNTANERYVIISSHWYRIRDTMFQTAALYVLTSRR